MRAANVKFNFSRADSLGLLAVGLDCELGVDIERIRPLPDLLEVANRFFCRKEIADLMSLTEDRERGFSICWTRKEAYLQCLGEGLFVPLNSFRVTLLPGEPARLEAGSEISSQWTLENLDIAPQYAAALAYHGCPRSLHIFPTVQPDEVLSLLD